MIREEAKPMFGDMLDIPTQELMRDATPEEQEAIDKYIKSISKPTGVNVFDFFEDEEQEQIDFVQPKKKIPCTIKAQADEEKNCFNCKWYPDNDITKGFDEVCHKCSNSDKWEGLIKRVPWEDIAPPPKIPEAQADGEYILKKDVMCCIGQTSLHWELARKLRKLPSVAIPPEHDGCKDCRWQSRSETEMPCKQCKHNYTDEWQKKPHWIEHEHEAGENWEYSRYECSECHEWSDDDSNFCPNCGARMVDPQERSE